MKTLTLLALSAAALTLSNCVCKDGKCVFAKKKQNSECCSTPKKGESCCH